MKWLSKLFAASAQTEVPRADPEHDGDLEEVSEADWVAFEADLVRLLEVDLARFAQAHPDEEFCTLGLDCNAAYCDILLCANTTAALKESALRYANDEEGGVAAAEEEMRWGFGDWKYHGFNLAAKGDWERYHAILPGGDELHTPQEWDRFLLAAARALLALERSGAIATLRRSANFAVACIGHDEDYRSADQRLRGLRMAVA